MIVTALNGGLGNQMFQYAVGRRIALERDDILKLEVSNFERSPNRTYRLHAFSIKQSFCTAAETALFEGREPHRRALRFILRTFVSSRQYTVLGDPEVFVYTSDALSIPGNLLLKGYWQNHRYFETIESVLRKDFALKSELSAATKAMSKRIRSHNSVSLHIRRGDYVSDPKIRALHGTSLDHYYQMAVKLIAQKVPDLHFFVFSDEPGWAHENLDLGYPSTIVDHNGPDKDYEDMYLMSLCQHHIIANSSFSWWGAWLGRNREKVIIAPRQWLTTEKYDTSQVTPPDWIRL